MLLNVPRFRPFRMTVVCAVRAPDVVLEQVVGVAMDVAALGKPASGEEDTPYEAVNSFDSGARRSSATVTFAVGNSPVVTR